MSVSLNTLRSRVRRLQRLEQPVQKTPEWFEARRTRITASEVSSCLTRCESDCGSYVEAFGLQGAFDYNHKACNSYGGYESYIIRKCEEFYGEHQYRDNEFTIWGKKYEDVACNLYSRIKGVTVHEFGLIPHPKISFLGASPDGITPDGVMLEIKCPKSRKINPLFPPLYYYHQMLLQLECCNLEECDYLECEIAELSYAEWIQRDVENPESQAKGIILQWQDKQQYEYPPKELCDPIDFLKWASHFGKGWNPIYYYVERYNIMNIKRSKSWLENVKGKLQEASQLIRRLQDNREEFEQYRNDYWTAQNQKYIQKFETTECLLDTSTECSSGERGTEGDDDQEESFESGDVVMEVQQEPVVLGEICEEVIKVDINQGDVCLI